METYRVKRLKEQKEFSVTVPGSKSVTNRALMLAALSSGSVTLEGVLFSDDSRAFLDCLERLGYELQVDEANKRVQIQGTGGRVPKKTASINVRSAGTAARFLTVMLSAAGGDYVLDSSPQMRKRPMAPLIELLRSCHVEIRCLGEEGHFPFELHSHGICVNELSIDTTVSSQFASALMLAGNQVKGGLRLTLTGDRVEGAFIQITRKMLEQFGIGYEKKENVYVIPEGVCQAPSVYVVEPDVSAACYFWGIAAINGKRGLVRRVSLSQIQGDLKFLDVMKRMGCQVGETEEGTWLQGPDVLHGVCVDMKDFSDQTMTVAAVAAFAEGATEIQNVAHIRLQESDRLAAVVTELNRLGVGARATKEGDREGIHIEPAPVQAGCVETYEDHRMAMAFAMMGTKVEGIEISNPSCCGKTFENYFEVLDEITE